MEHKCSKCNMTKAVDAFYRDRNRKSGFHPYCKSCHNQYTVDTRKAKGRKFVEKLVTKKCFRCNTPFEGPIKKKYCSKECRYSGQSDRMQFEVEIGTGRYDKRPRIVQYLE